MVICINGIDLQMNIKKEELLPGVVAATGVVLLRDSMPLLIAVTT
jgi:hypothetical protein